MQAQVSVSVAQQHSNAFVVTLQHKAHTMRVQVRNNYRPPQEVLQADAEQRARLYGNWLWEWRNGEGSIDESIELNGVLSPGAEPIA